MDLAEFDAQLESLDASLAKLNEAVSPLELEAQTEKLLAESIEDEYQRKIEQLQEEMREKVEVHRQAQKAKAETLRKAADYRRQCERDRLELLKQKEEAIKLERAQEGAQLLNQRWETMLMGAPWREFAKDHQMIASKQWAQQKRMILADEMGLGKTLEAIMGLDFIRTATEHARPDNPYEADTIQTYVKQADGEWGYQDKYVNGVERPSGMRALYLCPSSLILNVIEEFRKWAPHRNIVPIGNIPDSARAIAFDTAKELDEFVIILNYEAWRNSDKVLDKLVEMGLDSIILDEAHSFKETKTTVFRGIKYLVDQSDIGFVLPMTGTPLLNKPEDVYPPLYLIDPDRYGTKRQFLDRFCRQDWDGKWHFQTGGIEALATQIGKKYLRRTKTDAGIELPDQTIRVHEIKVDSEQWPDQARARKSMKENAMILLKDTDDYGNPKALTAAAVIALYTRLRQIETWPAGIVLKDKHGEVLEKLDIQESQKLDYVINWDNGLLPQIIANNRRAIVFSQFVAPLEELRDRIEALGYRAAVLTGETDLATRNVISRDFDKKHTGDDFIYNVVLCHYKVGGVGLNLTAATETIILDEEWNPGKRDQAYARNHRIGQDEEVTVHVLQMAKTIDDWLSAIMSDKEKLVDGFNKTVGVPDINEFLGQTNDSGLL